ncbi:class I adenylate-forming enzyme family protein [Desulfoluna spongiiphila]|uniref:Acyl-CoA synthetase (AMP-forming)/AMP-acid ligase II n=1 Tax=Desulfoluna spongiiphila TaxID=419481 RepID=A0A1G5JDQ1_9BACT|nr:class I adenylate-forming enzyme family protein [Desulfoluna spongiiphila]SCY86455.1 Acyl-CoA synthetase (AMP-forming)/AMP-acid ligase II [Desulfoluna spongiiphila]
MTTGTEIKDYDSWQLPLISDYVRKWAKLTPSNDALISAETGQCFSYREFDEASDLYAMALTKMGLEKGDILVTQFLAVPEFFLLVYGCLKAGVIISPVDIRLQPHEVVRDIGKVQAKAFFCPGTTPMKDFTEVVQAVRQECPSVTHIVQWMPFGLPGDMAEGSLGFDRLFGEEALAALKQDTALRGAVRNVENALTTRDPALIIFTTGTTGDPKPALLCHENILINNMVAGRGASLYGTNFRLLNVMPTSHVAGTSQGPMSAWFAGGSVCSMGFFAPDKAMEALATYRSTFIGGVPTHFRMLWALPDYETYDRRSLRFALYGGSAVDTAFLEQLAEMSPLFGTAYGMTESGGFFSATPKGLSVSEMSGQVGQFFPDLAPVTIRKPMNPDGTAGEVVPKGEVGEICVEGGIVFLGYVNNEEATRACRTTEGILYTGDMGSLKPMGGYEAIVFAGRRKFVIKPKGYLVFPDEVADHLTRHPKVSQAQVVGAPHDLFTDGVFAFVQPTEEGGITEEELAAHCKQIASYKRPCHVHFWPVGEQFPVNKVNKVDLLTLTHQAEEIVEELREQGGWDR